MIIVNVFDPKDYDIYVYGPKYTEGNNSDLRTVENWGKATGADWVFNLAFFNFDNAANRKIGAAGRTLQYVHNPKTGDIGYDDLAGGRTPLITLPSGSKFRGYGVIINNGVIMGGLKNDKRSRNLNGLTADGKYIHVTTTPQTEYIVATNVISYLKKYYNTTVKYLFREDGGGSVSEYSGISKLAYYPEGVRAIPTVVCVKRKTIYTFNRTISRGSQGEDVRILQSALGGLETDGIAGNLTVNRIKLAQKKLGLQADGYAGPLTLQAMGFKYNK